MKKVLGILALFLAICVVTTLFHGKFVTPDTIENNIRRVSIMGFISIGVAFVIITGGIDLSIGSVVALGGVLLVLFLNAHHVAEREVWPEPLRVAAVDESQYSVTVVGGPELFPGDQLEYQGAAARVGTVAFARAGGEGQVAQLREKPLGWQTGGQARATRAKRFETVSVDHKSSALVLRGAVPLGPNDRLLFSPPRSGETQHLTVASARTEGADTRVIAREIPLVFQAGLKVSPARFTHTPAWLAVALVLVCSLGIGLWHAWLVTKARLQPFVVTLCGLLIYRGLARFVANDQMMGLGAAFGELKYLASGTPFSLPVPLLPCVYDGGWSRFKINFETGEQLRDAAGQPIPVDWIAWIDIPMPLLLLLGAAAAAVVFLNYTIYGRYLLALGRNEEAARFSGINTKQMIGAAYVACAAAAGFTGVLYVLDLNSVQPSSGATLYELYAIAAAVLGGCSLRGGEGSIPGVLVGAGVMVVLYSAINFTPISNQLEYVIIGGVILFGALTDEIVRYLAARRKARQG